jgi:N-methylhydantoinase A
LHRDGGIRFERQVDVRYFGQSRYMTVPAPHGAWGMGTIAELAATFNSEHEREYGYAMPASVSEVEFVNLRVLASCATPRAGLSAAPVGSAAPRSRTRRAWFASSGFVEVPVEERSSLRCEEQVPGPAIVEQADSTTVLPPGCVARVGTSGELIIDV